MSTPEDILGFWFEGITDKTPADKKTSPFQKWFSSSRQMDAVIRERFAEDLKDAAQGLYRDWEHTPPGRLALILLFDQFSRNIYRQTPEMYRYDPLAVALSRQMVETSAERPLQLIERVFVYMPFMHSEDREVQELSVQCFEGLVQEAEAVCPGNVPYYRYTLDYAQQHRDTVFRFGRFPHRNAILQRAPTGEEAAFLEK